MLTEEQLPRREDLQPLSLSIDKELEETAEKLTKQQRKELKRLKAEALDEYQIKGSEEDWSKALQTNGKKASAGAGSGLISVKSGSKRMDAPVDASKDDPNLGPPQTKKKKKNKSLI